MFKYFIEDLQKKAEDLAEKVSSPAAVLLFGDIGTGKTTFSQFFIKKLLIKKNQSVTSPTFNIIQIYETKKGDIWHADLYRIEKEMDLFDLGLIEACSSNICLIEWPDIIKKFVVEKNVIELCL